MPTPSYPKPDAGIGPHGFSFPSTFQDSFMHKPIQIAEDDENMDTDEATSEKNRLERLRKGSALTINIPQSSGYDIYDENPKDIKKNTIYTMDIEQDNHDNNLQEQKQFIDSPDGPRRKRRRRSQCYWSKCRIGLSVMAGAIVLFIVIFGAIYLSKYLDSQSDDKDSDDVSTRHLPVEIFTTPKTQIITDLPPSMDPPPVVAIRMVVDEDYVQHGKGHIVLWRAPRGKHIHQGITYNNGSFSVSVDGYYTYTSTLKFDTRVEGLTPGKEIRFHHCVKINNTQETTCSTNGIPVDAIRSDIVQASWVHLRAGQEVYVTISKVGFISDTSDSNTFTMSLMSKTKKAR